MREFKVAQICKANFLALQIKAVYSMSYSLYILSSIF